MYLVSNYLATKFIYTLLLVLSVSLLCVNAGSWKRREDKTKCPKVKGIKNFDISGPLQEFLFLLTSISKKVCDRNEVDVSTVSSTADAKHSQRNTAEGTSELRTRCEFLGSWFIVQYYASSEEALDYRCMQAEFSMSPENAEVTMNFTYSFTDDPINEQIIGNITWKIPSQDLPAHWVHAEETYEGVYNTYILDSDYKSWALLMHCAEKSKSPRYLSSFIMSRERTLGPNVISYLREKLPRYDIDLEYMFPMEQKDCTVSEGDSLMIPPVVAARRAYAARRHPLKRKHRRS